MLKERLEFKILSVGFVILIVGVITVSLFVFFIVKDSIKSIAEDRLKASAMLITKGIEETMLDGKAEVTVNLIKDFKAISDFEGIEVYNHQGREAFKPDAPIAEAETLKRLIESRASLSQIKGTSLTFYMPLDNLPRCHSCHGAETPMLGAIKISVSLEKEQDRIRNFMLLIALGSLLGTGILGMLFWQIIRRLVIKPLRTLESNAIKMAEGDLSFKTDISTKDEIGKLDRSIKDSLHSISIILQMVKEVSGRISITTGKVDSESGKILEGTQVEAEAIANISSSVEELNAAITEIVDSTESLSASVEQTASSSEQMASSIGSVTYITQELSGGIEATSSSIEEMSATIKEVADNSENLAKVSEETLSAVEEIIYSIKEVDLSAKESARLSEKVTKDASTLGVTAINKTMQGMQKIKTSVEKTADVIKKLGGRSEEIGKILIVIDDITDQTTLLALNAAILASQAREHGKGFSVVADEIKDLAERTAFSTQEIDTLIQSVRQEVKDATEAMHDGLVSVEEGLKLSGEASDALKKILESSKFSSEMAISIERSTTEQAKAAKLVSESIERVRSMVSQIAKATSEQSKGIMFILSATEKMRNAAHQVTSATNQQASASRQIAQAVEVVSDKSKHISRAIYEQKVGSGQIRDAVNKIKDLPRENRDIAFRVNKSLRELSKDSDLVIAEVEKFKLLEEKAVGVIQFGIVPLESPADMFRKFTPLSVYLSKKLGKKVELKVAQDFESAIKDLGQGITQLSYMTPSTYIEARNYGATLLVKALRDGKPFHHSAIITKAGSTIGSLRDIKNRSFAFGDIHSTSSHIVPRAMLLEEGIDLKDLHYYDYLGHHDDVIKAVLKEEFDAGGVMEATINKFKAEPIHIVKFSDDIPEFNICAGASLSDSDRARVKSALLELDVKQDEDSLILKSIDRSYTGFTEAKDEDYSSIRIMMSKLGIL
ncbi:MAG: phosphate/phosphite/phosphonate ABC transporter substrate-binding protein [Nitrospirae bacterium]|nr:phosphate/phosphite/phosphonate ABC transporter substrate-binding protein [Nitrospirota bacterium]